MAEELPMLTANIRILIVDDKEVSCLSLKGSLQRLGYEVFCASNGLDSLTLLAEQPVSLVVSELVMPEMDGIQLLRLAQQRTPGIPFIVLTARSCISSAVAAMKLGAFDYLEKPVNPDTFDVIIQRALKFSHLAAENIQLQQHLRERYSFQSIITHSPAMRRVLEMAARLAASPKTTICLIGESGAGKEVLCRAIHFASGCLPGSFVAINCAAIPESLLESELFGHVRGAFTGAEQEREGKFSLARGGTVLLDEIGDMPLSLQAKLLRVLEERTYEKVGSNKLLPADFRVIVATHRDLGKMVQNGRFREDLFHRINVVPLNVPPLRERKEDIPLLADHFLNLFRQHQGKSLPGISKRAMDLLTAHTWPGNIRELRNVLEYAALMVSDELIRPEHLRLNIAQPLPDGQLTTTVDYIISLPPEELSLDSITATILDMTLQRCGGNKSQAAALLKVNRKMFYR